MESVLHRAIKAVSARKRAVIGEAADSVPSHMLAVANVNETEARAILSGFDIDHDEIAYVVRTAGRNLSVACAMAGEPVEVWTGIAFQEGFMLGLMVGKIAAEDAKRNTSDSEG